MLKGVVRDRTSPLGKPAERDLGGMSVTFWSSQESQPAATLCLSLGGEGSQDVKAGGWGWGLPPQEVSLKVVTANTG